MQLSSHNSAPFSPVESPGSKGSVWPLAVVALGLSVTVGWTILLAYGLITLVEHAI